MTSVLRVQEIRRSTSLALRLRIVALMHTGSLAFLAPKLVQAAVEGRLPRGIGVTRLRDAPAEWSRQYAMLGLSI
jgi:hypothetical protein